jgi:hypothetical protein
MPFEPHQSWVDCITNFRWCLPVLRKYLMPEPIRLS